MNANAANTWPWAPPNPHAALTPTRRFDPVTMWFNALCLVLLGYAFLGKGFAYLGVPPLFVGEVVLLAGALLLLICPAWRTLLNIPVVWAMLAMFVWGLACTLPFIGRYKVDALRDAVIFAYGMYGLIVMGWLIARPAMLGTLLGRFQRLAVLFVFVAPGLYLFQMLFQRSFPTWPWASHVTLLYLKPGEVLVHLGGVGALAVVGLFPRNRLIWPLVLLGGVAVVGVVNRGGLVSFAFMVCVAFCFYPRSLWVQRMFVVGILAVVALAAINPEIQTPDDRRKISFEQLSTNVMSLVTDVNTGDLDGTKQWRIDWWTKIVDYTLYGEYFWRGKGFGVNLANSDGFQVDLDHESLRSPHNGHMTILARMGVPGMGIWLVLHGGFALMMLNAIRRATWRGDDLWRRVFVFLLAYWSGFMLNASFDVFIEGPMGGVWFWTITGVGVAAVWLHRYQPQAANLEGSLKPCE